MPTIGQTQDSGITSRNQPGPAPVVVVHRGARDNYQVARGLAEAGMLDSLVTDVYWPGDRAWAAKLEQHLPAGFAQQLRARFAPNLPSSSVHWTSPAGPLSFLLDRVRQVPFARRRQAQRWTDAELGRKAGRLAKAHNSQLLSYSYYGYHAFTQFGQPGVLFQVHPHPVTVRRLLSEELAAHPDCASSLMKEWELALPQSDFVRLAAEPSLASQYLCASSFTRTSLIENGASASQIRVVPYGVDASRFQPAHRLDQRRKDGKFRLLFVGTINQRKGIKYLLEAMQLLTSPHVQLVVCGRVVDDLPLFRSLGDRIEVRRSVSESELQRAYQEADLFVFPSIVEGFAQVLLEALSCGLPILSTTHTAAPDLIDEGIQGFVVPPRRPDLLAERIDWLASHPTHLPDMREAARRRALEFSWARFRAGIVDAMRHFGTERGAPSGALHV